MSHNPKDEAKYHCRNLSGSYNYITERVGLKIGYETCSGISYINDYEAISIAFTIHELKRSKRDAFYYLVGIDIQNKYRLTNKSSIGLIPRIGYGYNLSVADLFINIGYIIYDYNNISSEFNEYTLSVGIGINLIEFFNYVVLENH